MRYFNLKPFYFKITHGANAFCKIFSGHIERHFSDDTPYKKMASMLSKHGRQSGDYQVS